MAKKDNSNGYRYRVELGSLVVQCATAQDVLDLTRLPIKGAKPQPLTKGSRKAKALSHAADNGATMPRDKAALIFLAMIKAAGADGVSSLTVLQRLGYANPQQMNGPMLAIRGALLKNKGETFAKVLNREKSRDEESGTQVTVYRPGPQLERVLKRMEEANG